MLISSHGILGINARNQKYLRAPRKSRHILDSKLLTKKLLRKNNLPFLSTIAVIRTRKELLNFNWGVLPDAFALKPNRGLGGEGIIVVYGRKKRALDFTWIKFDGAAITKKELEAHIFDTLDGNFSLLSLPDVAFFEERVKVAKELKPYSFKGIPDIRIIVYQKVPVMAALRLPTRESKGKANLHQGGIEVGIDLGTGLTTNAVYRRGFIDYYPGTKYLLRGIKVPYFKEILNLSVLAQNVVKIGFLGVDIAIDREKGPVVLELNGRPGLAIQAANLAGLEKRLKRVEGLELKSEKRGVRLARDLFGESEEEIEEEISGKKILGVVEKVEIVKDSKNKYKTYAKIDTGAWRTSVSFEIAQKLGIKDSFEQRKVRSSLGEEVRTVVSLSFILAGEEIDTEVYLSDRSQMKYEMIVGRRDLKNFIVEPTKIRK